MWISVKQWLSLLLFFSNMLCYPHVTHLLRTAYPFLVSGSHTQTEFQQDFILHTVPSQTYLCHMSPSKEIWVSVSFYKCGDWDLNHSVSKGQSGLIICWQQTQCSRHHPALPYLPLGLGLWSELPSIAALEVSQQSWGLGDGGSYNCCSLQPPTYRHGEEQSSSPKNHLWHI